MLRIFSILLSNFSKSKKSSYDEEKTISSLIKSHVNIFSVSHVGMLYFSSKFSTDNSLVQAFVPMTLMSENYNSCSGIKKIILHSE